MGGSWSVSGSSVLVSNCLTRNNLKEIILARGLREQPSVVGKRGGEPLFGHDRRGVRLLAHI